MATFDLNKRTQDTQIAKSESASVATSPVKMLDVKPTGILEGIGIVQYVGFAGGANKVPAIDIHFFLNQNAVNSSSSDGWRLMDLSDLVHARLKTLGIHSRIWQGTANPNHQYDPYDPQCRQPAGFNANIPVEGHEPKVGGFGHLVFSVRQENFRLSKDRIIAECLGAIGDLEGKLTPLKLPERY